MKGKNILVVEDIYDTGSTIIKCKETLHSYAPQSLKFAIIFHKKNPFNIQYNYIADYLGFMIPNYFVVGYGMDYNEYFRDMGHLCVINQEGIQALKDPRQ